MDDVRLTQGEVDEATAYFNLATLLGKSIQAAAFAVTHPDYNPELVVWLDRQPVPQEEEEDEDEDDDEIEAEDTAPVEQLHDSAAPADRPIIYSGEGSIDDQIEQLIAMYTPGLWEFIRKSSLPAMFHIACEQFSFEMTDPEQEMSPADKRKAALAWVIVKRVFALRHPDESVYIVSATESGIRENPNIQFRPLDDTDRLFIVETCGISEKILAKDMPLPDMLASMAEEMKRAQRAESVGRLAPLGSVPNGDALGWLYRVVSNGSRLRHSNGNRHESIIEQRKGDTVRYTRSNRQNGNTFTVEIAQADKYLSKTNKTFKKLLLFSLQKLAAQNEPVEVGFSLQELVDLGMYSTPSNAIRGIKEFFAQQKQTTISGTFQKGRKTIREEGGILYYHYSIENGYVKLSVNEKFNLDFITNYYTVFPRFAYALSNNAFSLVRYIFFIARQNTQRIREKGTFTISLDAVRENLGLPAPEDVKNRKYKQYIIDPIEEAIEEIEVALQTVPEAKEYGLTITPVASGSGNINQWLEGYLEIGLNGDFAETFIRLATKKEAQREKWAKIKNAELAKLAAKKEAAEEK